MKLEYLHIYEDELREFLKKLNENINWDKEMRKIFDNRPFESSLSVIQSYIWKDTEIKDEGEFDEDLSIEFIKYHDLLSKNNDKIFYIISFNPENDLTFLNNILIKMLRALTSILNFTGRKYIEIKKIEELDNISENYPIITTAGILHIGLNEKLKQVKNRIIYDGVYNIIPNKENKKIIEEKYFVFLSILSLHNEKIEDIIKKQYEFIESPL